MIFFDRLSEKIRKGEPIPLPLDLLLSAACPLYQLGMGRRLRAPRTRVRARVISFGNLTVGGVGKTPAVIECAQTEIAAGKTVAVLSRGYKGAQETEPVIIAPGGYQAGLAACIGDEPALIARRVPEAHVIKAADRVAGAEAAVAECGCDTVILDDGYQHVMLERDRNVLVIDAGNPFGNGKTLPRGILREPLSAMRRATEILLTRCDQAPDLDPLRDELAALVPTLPVRCTRHAPQALERLHDGAALPLESLRGRKITAACAIGNPDAFFKTLEDLGAVLREKRAYPNHSAIPLETLPEDGMVVLTEKDAIRCETTPDNLHVLSITIQVF